MARILIIEGSSRGLYLARTLVGEGHAVRVLTSDPERSDLIEQAGAECFLGDLNRLASLRGVLEQVAIACWLLADVQGSDELVRALHGPRLERFLCAAVDTTLRGVLYEAGGNSVPVDVLAEGRRIVLETAARNLIPAAILTADPCQREQWLEQAQAAIGALLDGRNPSAERYAGMYIPKSRSAFAGEASTQEDS